MTKLPSFHRCYAKVEGEYGQDIRCPKQATKSFFGLGEEVWLCSEHWDDPELVSIRYTLDPNCDLDDDDWQL